MPFTTKSGGYCFDDGVILTHKNEKGETVKGNGLEPKFLTQIAAVGLDVESEEFKMAVMRGQPRPNGTSWEVMPVFIIQHYNFDDDTWKRFLKNFEGTLAAGKTSPDYLYEPAVFDIIDLEYGRRAMPLWVIEHLQSLGVFEAALEETKCESRAKKVTQAQYDLIIKAIKDRIKLEKSETLSQLCGPMSAPVLTERPE